MSGLYPFRGGVAQSGHCLLFLPFFLYDGFPNCRLPITQEYMCCRCILASQNAQEENMSVSIPIDFSDDHHDDHEDHDHYEEHNDHEDLDHQDHHVDYDHQEAHDNYEDHDEPDDHCKGSHRSKNTGIL